MKLSLREYCDDCVPDNISITPLYPKPFDTYGNLPYHGEIMAEETQTTARLEARLPNDVHALLKRAAEIEGRSLTDFVVSAAREAACRTIEETEIIRLSVEDQRQIAEALLNPPEPTPALKKAFQRRRELLGVE
jgi:uncharacterized protein (DUF1778 family)